MPADLVAQETALYRDLWVGVPAYSQTSPGEQLVPLLLDMAGLTRDLTFRYTVLDAGCGSGKGALALQAAGFGEVRLCDLTDAGLVDQAKALRFHQTCLWDDLRVTCRYVEGRAFDYVYCCDVLEHIPPQFTMLVVSRLLEVARHGVFLSISLVPDVMGAWVGQTLHQTVQSFLWWRDSLAAVGTVLGARDLLTSGVYFVAPKAGRC